MFSLLITIAELVLPYILVMAVKPDQIPPDFSLCHIQYLNSLCIPTRIQDLSFSRYTFVFFF